MIYLKIKNRFHFSYRNMIHHILDSFRVFGGKCCMKHAVLKWMLSIVVHSFCVQSDIHLISSTWEYTVRDIT